MAPTSTSLASTRESRVAGNSRESTPTMARPGTALTLKAKNDAQLATSFKADLTDIRTLVTCTICDQLLYEPWTLGCGHTYCYSCLCSWFTTNRRKKTCPECRAKVLIIPAPNFLIKQMVDQVFTKRRELMPADESIEQHGERRAEEIATVEQDRKGAEGLFKGLFPKQRQELMLDEADGGILRCPGCGNEFEGGPACGICGLLVEDPYGFSDMDDDLEDLDELDDLEQDLDEEIGAEFAHQYHGHVGHHHFAHAFLDLAAQDIGRRHLAHHNHNHFHHHHPPGSITEPSDSEDESDLSSVDNDSDDSDNSLNDFVVQDDAPLNRPATGASNSSGSHQAINLISDDESDEGGAISNRRPRQRVPAPRRPNRYGNPIEEGFTPSESPDDLYGLQYDGRGSPARTRSPSAVTVTDTDTNASEAGDHAALLRSGWSPLDHGNDSDADGPIPPYFGRGQRITYTDDEDDSENSDTGTETATEHGHNDDDDRSRDSLSQTPVPFENRYQSHIQNGIDFFDRHPYEHQEETDDDSEGRSNTDLDGDTDMTPASPRSRDSRSVSANPYFNNIRGASNDFENYGNGFGNYDEQTPRGERALSLASTTSSSAGGPYDGMFEREEQNRARITQVNEQRNGHQTAQQLGSSNDMQHAENDSSDSSIRPIQGRRSRRPQTVASVQQQYDPRISMMFAEHQAARGSQENPISFLGEESEDEIRVVEPGSSRNPARRMTAYRNMPTRRVDPLRSSRSPSSTRVISSSQRNNRLPRQYSRRG